MLSTTKTLIIINQGITAQIALRINKHNTKDFTNEKHQS